MTRIITRQEWGAVHRAGFGVRTVGRLSLWLHHSVTASPGERGTFAQDAATIRELERIGQQRFGGGISYTFAITEAGRAFEGTGVARVGSHTRDHNNAGVGVVLVGNYELRAPTAPQRAALAWLLNHGVARGWWTPSSLTGGHRDVSATACPGRHAYALIPHAHIHDEVPEEDDIMQRLVIAKLKGSSAVWVGDGLTRRLVSSTVELADIQWQITHGVLVGDPTVLEVDRIEWLGRAA